MNFRRHEQSPHSFAAATVKRVLMAAASCLMLGATVTACAAVPVYNPDHLQAVQFEHVSDICQNVMGLSPQEPLKGGDWLGQPRLDYDTSHYRVCIISLSDSLQSAVDARLTQQADADCRAKGLTPGSSDLALCVLNYVNERPADDTQPASATLSRVALPQPTTSYYYASPHDYVRRERIACAALGLEPAQSAFDTCVANINHALHAIDTPIS
jgi:hypothetical protein